MGLLYRLARTILAGPPPRRTPPQRTSPPRDAAVQTGTVLHTGTVVRTETVVVHAQAFPAPAPRVLRGRAWVVDGDTIVIDGVTVRLAGIDAPELDHPYGRKARSAMIGLCRGQIVTATLRDEMSHDRVVATCILADGRDLAAELVRMGLAVDWPKYSGGRYRHLETPDARSRLWRCDARQRGRLPPRT